MPLNSSGRNIRRRTLSCSSRGSGAEVVGVSGFEVDHGAVGVHAERLRRHLFRLGGGGSVLEGGYNADDKTPALEIGVALRRGGLRNPVDG